MSFIDAKYIGLVSSRLHKFARKKEGLYNFRCPYCGDSQRTKNKARGYLYKLKNDHNFKCHNCGVSRTFTNFLKDMDTILYDQYVMERYKNGLTGKGSQTKTPEIKFEKPNFSKKSFDLPTIEELNKEHLARQYLENRKIPKEYFRELYFCQNFKEWTNTQKYTFENLDNDEPRIIIPLINQGKIFGFQGRSLNKNSKVKYITIILDDNNPKIYGLDKANYTKTVYVVEGPIDSMFLDNAIAMVGADLDYMLFNSNAKSNFVMVYDNEKRNKQIIERMQKAIDSKFSIVIWPNDLKEKDINDMILSGIDVTKIINQNTFTGLEAKAKLIGWKRV
jgi:transcription elongation factor Elf1